MPKPSRSTSDAPFSNLDEKQEHENYGTTRQHGPPSAQFVMEGYDAFRFSGDNSPEMLPQSRDVRETVMEPREYSSSEMVCFPLMRQTDSAKYLSKADAAACQSIELFSLPFSVERKFGLRCLHCRTEEDMLVPGAVVVPQSVDHVAKCVRQLAEDHIPSCDRIPAEIRKTVDHATRKRHRKMSESKSGWEEDEYLAALTEFCMLRCRGLGIVNESTEGGILQRDNEGAGSSKPHSGMDVGHFGFNAFQRYPTYHHPLDESSRALHFEEGPMNSPDMRIERRVEHGMEPLSMGPSADPIRGYGPNGAPDSTPFFQTPNGDWLCRFCCHLPPAARNEHFIWSTPSKAPPTKSFVDYHLSLCREYNQGNFGFSQATPIYVQQGHPQLGGAIPPPIAWGVHPNGQSHYFAPAEPVYYPPLQPVQHTERSPRLETPSRPAAKGRQGSLEEANHEVDSDMATQQAIAHLAASERSYFSVRPEESRLVLEEDKLLLTDYFFFLMKQLQLVRFSEADRRTRGGKREKIKVGYGGLQCIHCVGEPKTARKFFWSNVDRLANSFAEIPGHIMKCRSCPKSVKDALLQLKTNHPNQMSRLPRGSQKVFFRRVWRRLHDNDPDEKESSSVHGTEATTPDRSPKVAKPRAKVVVKQDSPAESIPESEETSQLLIRPAAEAARALVNSVAREGSISPSSRVLLALPEDKEWVSDIDCFVRSQIEVFAANSDDVRQAQADRKVSVQRGQVGIRCVHCAMLNKARLTAVAYPSNISGLYEAIREFHRLHLDNCPSAPPSVKSKLADQEGSSSLSSVLRKYYVESAYALGLQDSPDGIRVGGKSVPLGPVGQFSFPSDDVKEQAESTSRKRKMDDRVEGSKR